MFVIILIILLSIDISITNNPILIASPYPFNRSESSHIECFSNDQGIILSLTIIASMLDIHKNSSLLQYTQDNITKNGSIVLIIPAPFNYSQLHSKIECHSKYHHGEQKLSELEVLSVAEIPQKEFLSMNTHTKQMITIQCVTYGTNVFIHWDFSRDLSRDIFVRLPLGIRIDHKFTVNDTLIIDHVSYSDHHGYYRCNATNTLLGITYQDKRIIYLDVKTNSIWIPIVIICVVIGIGILILICCSKYCQKKRKERLEEKEISQEGENISGKIQESLEVSSYYDKQTNSEQVRENGEELKMQEENIPNLSQLENSTNSRLSLLSTQERIRISKTSPQFVLGNPFLDSNSQSIISIQSYINKLK